jgi:protein-tyrosine-phosphatase
MLKEKGKGFDGRVKVSSAGFFPAILQGLLVRVRISPPDPFFGASMSEVAREELRKRGLNPPADWTSKELTPGDVKNSGLIIMSLPQQKEGLLDLFPEAHGKVFTLREIAGRHEPLVSEVFSNLPLDDTLWWFCEDNPAYVVNMLSDLEEALIEAFPRILWKLGIEDVNPR